MILNDDVMENINSVSATPQQAKEINNDSTISFNEKQNYLINPQAYENTKNTRLPDITAGQADTLSQPEYTSQIKNNINDTSSVSNFRPWNRSNNVMVSKELQEKISKDLFEQALREKEKREGRGTLLGLGKRAVEWTGEQASGLARGYERAKIREGFNELNNKVKDAETEEEREKFRAERDAYINEYPEMLEDENTIGSNTGEMVGQMAATMPAQLAINVVEWGSQAAPQLKLASKLVVSPLAKAGRFGVTYFYTKDQEAGSFYYELEQYNANQAEEGKKIPEHLMKAVADKYGQFSGAIEGGMDAALAGSSKAAMFAVKRMFKQSMVKAVENIVLKHAGELTAATVEEMAEEALQNMIQDVMATDAKKLGPLSGNWEIVQEIAKRIYGYSGRAVTGNLTEEDKAKTKELVEKVGIPTLAIGAGSKAVGGVYGKIAETKTEEKTETKAEAKEPTYNDRLSENIAVQENLTGRTLTQEEFNQVVDNTISEEIASKITEDMSDQEIVDTAVETVNNIQQEEELRQDAEVATASLDAELADNEDIVTEIANQEQTSSLKKEDVQAYNALKENSRNEDERPTLYYVDTDTAKEVIAALEATDNEELKTVVNSSDIAQKIEQAEQNGQDVEVSPEVWEEVLGDKKLFQIAKNGTAVYKDVLTPKKQKELVSKVYENNPDLHQSLEDKSSMVSRAYEALTKNKGMSEEQALANAAWLDTQANALWNAMSPEAQAEYESKEAFKSSVMPEIRQVGEIEEGDKLKQISYKDNENFKRWSENTKPITVENPNEFDFSGTKTRVFNVYHGTRQQNISEFKTPYADKLIFFSFKKEFADEWAKNAVKSEEQKSAQSFLDSEERKVREEINAKYKKDYGEKWWEDASIFQSAYEELKDWKSTKEKELGISPKTMNLFVKVHKIFDPRKDYKKVLKEIGEHFKLDFTSEDAQTKSDLERIKKGAWIYFENDKVIDKIYDLGYDAIVLRETTDGDITTLAVRSDKNIKDINNEGAWGENNQTLLQRTRGVIAGAFTPSLNLIELSKAHNVNTFMHETGHWVENFLTNLRASGKMNERLTKQWDNYMAKLGVEGEMTTAQRERFTEDMSTYVATGKLPDSKLGALFDFMRNMIMSVWKIIRHRRISQPVRDFFDRLYFTDQEIDNMRLQNKIGLLNKPAGWSDAAYQKYVDTANSVKNETVNKAVALQDEGRRIRESEDYQRKKQEFYDEKVMELQQDDDYKLRQDIIENPIYLGSIPDGVTLDSKFVTDNKNARSLDQVTAESDFDTMDELIDFLQNSKDIRDEAETYATDMADDWMVNEHPELSYTVADISDNVLAKVKTNVYNYMILSNQNENDFNKIYNDMIIKSESEINSTPISIMANPSNFTNSVNSLLNQYRVAEFNNNQKKMAELQRRLAAANYMVYRAKQLQRQMKNFSKHFRKYTKKATSSNLGKLSGYAFDIIHSVLHNFGFTVRKPMYDAKSVAGRIQNFISEVLDNSEYVSVFEAEDERLFLSNPDDTMLKKLSTEDFNRLDNDLRSFETMAIEDKGYKDKDKELQLVLDVKHLKDYRGGKTKDIGVKSAPFRMMEHEAKAMLPSDLFVKYQLSLQDGFAKAANFTNETWNKVNGIAKKLNQKYKKPFAIDVYTTNEKGEREIISKVFTVNNLLMMMLHSGNEHNLTSAVMTAAEKFDMPNITEEQYLDIIRRAPDDFRVAANEIWAEFAKTTQPLLEVGRQLNGQEMKIVKAEPIDFGDGGTKLTGGYFPADKVGQKKSIADMIVDTFKSPDQPQSFDGMYPVYKNKKERLAPHAGLDFDGGSLYGFIARTGQYLHVAVPAKETGKFYQTSKENGAVSDSEYNFFHQQIKDSVNQKSIDSLTQFGALSMRAGQLGLNPSTALLQSTVVVTALAENSINNTIRALMSELPHIFLSTQSGMARARELSPYMKQRYDNVSKTFFGEVQSTLKAKLGEKSEGKVLQTAKNIYGLMLSAISYLEAPMSIVAWKAAYADARAKGMTHEQAILKGDSVVRRFAGESMQGSSSSFYKSGYIRAFVPYMSYTMNIAAAIYAQVRGGNINRIGRYVAAIAGTYILEEIIRAAIKYNSAPDDEKKKLAENQLSYLIDNVTDIPSMIAEIGNIAIPVGGWTRDVLNYYEKGFTYDRAYPYQFIEGLAFGAIDIADYISYKEVGNTKKADSAKKRAIRNLGKGLGINTYQVGRWFNKFVDLLREKE